MKTLQPEMPSLAEQARRLSNNDLNRHAEVSLRHGCRCGECFCCACADELARRRQYWTEHPMQARPEASNNASCIYGAPQGPAQLEASADE